MINESLLGLSVGLALGLTGGGGVLAVPALVLVLGFSLQKAIPISLIAICIASFLGALDGFKRNQVRFRAAMLMALVGIVSAPLGIWLRLSLPVKALAILFSILLVFVSLRFFLQYRKIQFLSGSGAEDNKNCMINPETKQFYWSPKCFSTISTIGGASGLISGLMGVGSGIIIVTGIRQFSNLPMHSIVSTSLAVTTILTAVIIAQTLLSGTVISINGWWFIGSTCIGMSLARGIAPYIPARLLLFGFSALTFVAALMLLHKYIV